MYLFASLLQQWKLHKDEDAACCFEQILEAVLSKTAATHLPSYKPSKYGDQDMLGPAREGQTHKRFFAYGLLYMDSLVLVNQQRLTFISCVWTLDAVWRTYQEWWSIGIDSERESKETVLSAHIDDDDITEI